MKVLDTIATRRRGRRARYIQSVSPVLSASNTSCAPSASAAGPSVHDNTADCMGPVARLPAIASNRSMPSLCQKAVSTYYSLSALILM